MGPGPRQTWEVQRKGSRTKGVIDTFLYFWCVSWAHRGQQDLLTNWANTSSPEAPSGWGVYVAPQGTFDKCAETFCVVKTGHGSMLLSSVSGDQGGC